jgi:hypothetical protein
MCILPLPKGKQAARDGCLSAGNMPSSGLTESQFDRLFGAVVLKQ